MMNINFYYGIGHIGCLLSILIATITSIRYYLIRKKSDIFLNSWIFIFGMFCSILPTIGIISDEFIIKREYTTINASFLGVIILFVVLWLLGFLLLIFTSNYYVKVNDERLIIHSIWFSKIELVKNMINKKESVQVMIDAEFCFDQYFILKYEDKYIKIAFDALFQTMNNRKFIDFYVGLRLKMINKKEEYSRFKKNTNIISAGRLFYNRKK